MKKKEMMITRNNWNNPNSKRGQLTIFLILAIVLVAGIIIYYFVRQGANTDTTVPKEFQSAYSYYLSCVREEVSTATSIMGEQGGYIEQPEFSPGSKYMPFSSQLDFLGVGVPYWYYISGNGVIHEQKPSKAKMQIQLNDYLKDRLAKCDLSPIYQEGYEFGLGEPTEVSTEIKENVIDVKINQKISLKFGQDTWNTNSHLISVNSKLGKFYDTADKIYKNYIDTMFLEKYGVDILRLYAPVDGSEVTCSPKIWQVEKVRSDLMNALESNVQAIKVKGDYYTINNKDNNYFVNDIGNPVDLPVNFLYLKDWPMKMEVWPSEDGLLKANPVGIQEGLGMMGFCYTQYHFVYDFSYPVMIQIISGNEMFQFPVVVSIVKNNPRIPLNVSGLPDVVPELCEKKNSTMTVYTYDNELNPVPAQINFKCFDTSCDIGTTEIKGNDAVFVGKFPQCINGFVKASAEGYEGSKVIIKSLEETSVDLILRKKYKINLELLVGLIPSEDYAVITFEKNDSTKTVSYPEQKEVELTEGMYHVKAYVYTNSTIRLSGSETQKCIDLPNQGVLGYFGFTSNKCFYMNVPDQIIDNAISGGGYLDYYITEDQLKSFKKIVINTGKFGSPKSVEDLQSNYNLVDITKLTINLE